MADTIQKQPAESWLYDFNFAPRLAVGETITSISSVTQQLVDQTTGVRSATSELTISGQAATGQVAQARIAAGLTGKLYVITMVVGTSLSNTAEMEGYLLVQDT